MKSNVVLGVVIGAISVCCPTGVGAVPAAANVCIGCHGVQGISASPLWPNLAGQKEEYLSKQLKDFKSGERKDLMMGPITAALSEQDIQDLAKYFSQLK